jgi:AcrR family transcriptional regulator
MAGMPSQQRRAEITRHRVIEAAIEAFGTEGYERTTTRALVERAGTNLVAIHYHFGSKEAVYRAAAEHIASSIRERSRAVLERAQLVLDRPRIRRGQLVEAVCDVYDAYSALALAGDRSEHWRRFLLREQTNPHKTSAFQVVMRAIYPFFEAMFRLIARIISKPTDDPEVRLLTTMIFGHVYLFRANRAGALKILGWKRFGPGELRQTRAVARKYITKLLSA